MIERYSRPEMAAIWTLENKFRTWLEIELKACEIQHKKGVIPTDAWNIIKEKADFDGPRIDEIEAEVHHDVIAFLTSVAEFVGPESRYIHLGLTSSDVVDTGLAILMKQAGELLILGIDQLREVVARRAHEHKYTIMMGRTHGVHAEPMTMGLKLALWYEELRRDRERLEKAVRNIAVGKISGAVGTFAHLAPDVEAYVCQELGLIPAPISTQILQRDRHAEYMSTLAICAGTLEKMAVEIRHLQRSEVREAEEYFSRGQKGSSAMPHKRNPIITERITGMARLMRGYALTALENMALWHERDISHSSTERIIVPDATILLDYMLAKMTKLIDKLLIYPENMQKNMERTFGLPFSQRVLLKLAQKGVTREDAYRLVQRNAMKSWELGLDFKGLLLTDNDILSILSADDIERCFDLQPHRQHVDTIFERVGLPR